MFVSVQKRNSGQIDSRRVPIYTQWFFSKITASSWVSCRGSNHTEKFTDSAKTEKEHKENVLAIALPDLAEPGVSLLAPKIDFGTVLYHEKITLVHFCTRKKGSWYSFVPTFQAAKATFFLLNIHFQLRRSRQKTTDFFSFFIFFWWSGSQKEVPPCGGKWLF